jgi:hypothetical protein
LTDNPVGGLDMRRIVECFDRHRVEYLVVGAGFVMGHGESYRHPSFAAKVRRGWDFEPTTFGL